MILRTSFPRLAAVFLLSILSGPAAFANDFMIQAFVDCIWPHMLSDFPTAEDTEASELETSHRLGDALNYAKFYIAHKIHGDYTAPFEVYHLFGDPTMEIWTASPHPVLPDRFFDPNPYEPVRPFEMKYAFPLKPDGVIASLIQDGEIDIREGALLK